MPYNYEITNSKNNTHIDKELSKVLKEIWNNRLFITYEDLNKLNYLANKGEFNNKIKEQNEQ